MKEVDGLGTALAHIALEPSAQKRSTMCVELLAKLYPMPSSVLLASEARPDEIDEDFLVVAESHHESYRLTQKGRKALRECFLRR
jgi:hypothetical protein